MLPKKSKVFDQVCNSPLTKYIMKKSLFTVMVVLFLLQTAPLVSATSGACSGRGGVDCSRGFDYDGSVICNDGWHESSVMFLDELSCKNNNPYSDLAAICKISNTSWLDEYTTTYKRFRGQYLDEDYKNHPVPNQLYIAPPITSGSGYSSLTQCLQDTASLSNDSASSRISYCGDQVTTKWENYQNVQEANSAEFDIYWNRYEARLPLIHDKANLEAIDTVFNICRQKADKILKKQTPKKSPTCKKGYSYSSKSKKCFKIRK